LSFFKSIDAAVDCFRPLVKKLSVREDFNFERTVNLIEMPELDFLGGLEWSISLVRENLPNTGLCGRLVTRYRRQQNFFQYFIYLNEPLFQDTESARMKRKIVFIHEFTHFAACLYAYSTNKDRFISSLENKLDNIMDEIFNPDVTTLYHLLKEKEPKDIDPLSTIKYIQHTHFYLGIEKIELSYTDLYLNLLFSKGAFEEFFDEDNQKKFYKLWNSGSRSEAVDLYYNLAKEAATAKWVPEQFALDQAEGWIINYIQKPLL
jgi:hypothetical protein